MTLVLDVELDRSVDRGGAQVHTPVAVAERVVDEVAERLLETQAVAADRHSGRGVVGERPRTLLRSPLEPGHDRGQELVRVERLHAERQLPAIGAGDQQQVLGELGQAIDLLRRPAHRLAQLLRRAAVAQRQLELRAQQRERRSQLVPGVRDEVALALEGVLEPLEHLVQRLAEPLELVSSRGNREPLAGRLGRDLGRAPAHGLDRPERETGEKVPGDRGEDERDRACDQQLVAEAGQRLRVVPARRADDEHELAAVALDGSREQPRGLVQARDRRAVRVDRLALGCRELGRVAGATQRRAVSSHPARGRPDRRAGRSSRLAR